MLALIFMIMVVVGVIATILLTVNIMMTCLVHIIIILVVIDVLLTIYTNSNFNTILSIKNTISVDIIRNMAITVGIDISMCLLVLVSKTC